VCDAFFNVPGPLSGPTGLMLRATGTATGLRIGNSFRWLAIGDGGAYRAWLEAELAERPPTVLVPAHGDVIEDDDLGERLLQLVRRRL
jgi:glyoxylase-like metal-dependent hydrolase (beta-lactamase superfamily II)